mgnify:CR=1 FL=1
MKILGIGVDIIENKRISEFDETENKLSDELHRLTQKQAEVQNILRTHVSIQVSVPAGRETRSKAAYIVGEVIHPKEYVKDAIKSVKGKMPALYLMEEHGSATMVCGSNEVPRSEWETTMLCVLVFDQKDDSQVEQVILKDGRIGFVVQLGGTAEKKAEKFLFDVTI